MFAGNESESEILMQMKCHPVVEVEGAGLFAFSKVWALHQLYLGTQCLSTSIKSRLCQHFSLETEGERERGWGREGRWAKATWVTHAGRYLNLTHVAKPAPAFCKKSSSMHEFLLINLKPQAWLVSSDFNFLSSLTHQHIVATSNSQKRFASAEQMNLFHCCPWERSGSSPPS